jgi:PST family polysaccharide transporter
LILAYLHHGLIALFALQGLVGPFTFLLFRFYRPSTGFGRTTKRHIGDVWRIGMHLSLGSLTQVVWQNVPQLVLGRMVTVEALGLFVYCYRIIQLIFNQLSNVVNTVVYPTFARYRSEPQMVGRSFLKTVRFTYFCLMLPLIGLAVAPGSFLRVYGGGRWASADGILFYLVLMQMAISLGVNVFPTFYALGRPQTAWQWNLLITGVQSVAIVISARWGLLAVIKSLAASAWVMPLAVYWLSRVAQFRFFDYARNMAPLVGLLVPAVALGTGVQNLMGNGHAILTFAVSTIAATLLYIGLLLAIDSQAKQAYREVKRILRSRLAPSGMKA